MTPHLRSRRLLVLGGAAGGAMAWAGWGSLMLAYGQSPREIPLIAQRFRFTPERIALQVGEPVVLMVQALDFIHGFSVPDLGIRSDLLPGMVTRIPLTALQAGRLDFLCDNFCGEGHEVMHGYFLVAG